MSDRIHWTNHRSVKILVNNYHGLQGEALLEQIDLCVEYIQASGRKDILLLVDVTDVEVSMEGWLRFAGASKQIKGFCKRVAVIGLTPVKANILNAINGVVGLGAKGIKDEQRAKNWLTGRDSAD